MNKKNLSVVMAGAMLATSVAPVLADTTNSYETTKGNMGLLIDKLDTLLASKKFADTDLSADKSNKEAGKSVYRIRITNPDGTDASISGHTPDTYTINKKTVKLYSDTSVLKTLASNFTSNYYNVTVYELGNRTDSNGRIVSTEIADGTNVEYKTFNQGDIDNLANGTAPLFKSQALDTGYALKAEGNEDKSVTITLASKTGNEFNTINLKAGDARLDWTKPVDAAGVSIAHMDKEYIQANIAGFEKVPADSNVTAGTVVDITASKAQVAYTVKVNNGDVNYTVNVDDLYDGLMLTDKGHDLLNAIKTADQSNGKIKVNYTANRATGVFDSKAPTAKTSLVSNGSERLYTLTFTNTNTNTTSVVKIEGKSTEEDKMVTLLGWLKNRKANVDILAGSNRYATAVEIAKEYVLNQYTPSNSVPSEVVLVNGEALVDGLAAAPYAKQQGAPVLLTDSNSLPKETKTYLKELINKAVVENIKDIKVTIIGGEAVVSQNVVDELKEIGFNVRRISGDNREETSLAVASKINNKNKAFVVGAEGEADAMSIATYASANKSPIIVSKSTKGLSTVAINELGDYSYVEIIGGEVAVPAKDEEKIKEVVSKTENVTRINGKNRQETNALIIKTYHRDFDDILVAKDGVTNKSELVDALPVALFASSKGNTTSGGTTSAPVVLATDSLSDAQLNQIVLKSTKNGTLYQVGYGVSKTVMEKIADRLGLLK